MSATGRDLQIRRAGSADASTVRALVHEFAAHEGASARHTTTAARWSELLADDAVMVLLAVIDGVAVGYVSAVRALHLWSGRDSLALDDLFVTPDARGQAVAQALMWALADATSGHRIRWDVEEGNLRGQRCSIQLGATLRRQVVAWWEPPGHASCSVG